MPDELQGVGVDEFAGDKLPLDLKFLDHRGQPVTLGHYFRSNRPVILSLNYSNCPMLCNMQLTGLTTALQELEWSAGKEFQVVSISIDPLETTHRAAQSHQRYLQMYGRPGTGDGWNFLVGRQAEIDRISNALGFRYRYIREKKEYSHPSVFVMCTPDGRISRYVYGVEFAPRTLQLSLVEAGEGVIGTTWDRILLYCLHYNSTAGQYTPAAWKLVRIGGIATLITILGMWWRFSRRRSVLRSRPEAETFMPSKSPSMNLSASPLVATVAGAKHD